MRGSSGMDVPIAARRPTFAASKFALPEPAGSWVRRPALLARLDADVRLTLVAGSPGAGKTSILSQWAHTQPDGTVGWMTCDQADLDDTRFWHAFIEGVAIHRPGFAADGLDLLSLSHRVDPDLLESLLRACESLQRPLSLVLDDFQLVGAGVQDQLRFLLARGTGRLRILIGTRSEPMVGLDRLRMTGELGELRETDLRFSAADASLLLANLGVKVDAPELDVIVDRTEGWAAGLQLAAVAMRDPGHRGEFLARLHGSNQIIGHYLWSEVFEAQPNEVRQFLLDTSIVDELSPGLAAALSPGTPVTLLDIETANLLLVRLDPAGHSFRYHHLFVEMLRFRLRSTAPDHELLLHERAAEWYLDQRDAASAFRHQWRAGHRTAAIATMHGTVLDAYYDDLLPSFEDADRLLTDDDLTAAPGPAASYCMALLSRGFAADSERLASRIEVVAGAQLAPVDQQQLHAVRALDALVLGDTRATIHHGNALIELTGRGDVDDDWLALAVTAVARAQAWEGDHQAVAQVLRTIRPEPLSRTGQLEYSATIAFCRLMSGALTDALTRAQRLNEELAQGAQARGDVGLNPTALVGTVLLERGDFAAAEPLLQRVSSAHSILRLPVRVLAKIGLARLWRAHGDFDPAFAILDEGLQLIGRQPIGSGLVDHLQSCRARLLMESGESMAGRTIIDSISNDFSRSLLLVRYAILEGNLESARRMLHRVASAAVARRQRLDFELTSLTLAAACSEPLDDIAARVLNAASQAGFVLPIAEAGSTALDAVRRVARSRPRSAHVEALMNARPCTPAGPLAEGQHAYETLSERERTVLAYLDTSMTSREIANALFVSVNTIKTHTRNINQKLSAKSRREALARARELHYL